MKCPRCSLPVELASDGNTAACTGCGAQFKVSRKSKAAAPPPVPPKDAEAASEVEADPWDEAGGQSEPWESQPVEELDSFALPKQSKSKSSRSKNANKNDRPSRPTEASRDAKSWLITAMIGGGALFGIGAIGLLVWLFSGPAGPANQNAEPVGNAVAAGADGNGPPALAEGYVVASSNFLRLGRPGQLRQYWDDVSKKRQFDLRTMPEVNAPAIVENAGDDTREQLKGVPLEIGRYSPVPRQADLLIPLVTNCEVSPSGQTATVTLQDAQGVEETGVIYDLTTGQRTTSEALGQAFDPDHNLAPDPKGRWLFKTHFSELSCWRTGSTELPRVINLADASIIWSGYVDEQHAWGLVRSQTLDVQIWNFESGQRTASIPVPDISVETFGTSVSIARQSPNRRFVAIAVTSGVSVIDLTERKVAGLFPLPENRAVLSCEFFNDPDRLTVLIQNDDFEVLEWDLGSGQLAKRLNLTKSSNYGVQLGEGRLYSTSEPHVLIHNAERSSFRIDTVDGRVEMLGFSIDCKLQGPPRGSIGLIQASIPTEGDALPAGLPDAWRAKIQPEWRQRYLLFGQPLRQPQNLVTVKDAVVPDPPAKWVAPPKVDWSGPIQKWDSRAGWPQVVTDRYSVRFVPQDSTNPTNRKVMAERFDRQTGEPLELLEVCPTVLAPDVFLHFENNFSTFPLLTAAAIHDDGLLAYVSPADRRRISFWKRDSSRLETRTFPFPIRWIGFSVDGKLLLESSGKLYACHPETGESLWTRDGGYTGGCCLVRGRSWGVFHAGQHIDLIDTSTGACLGRLHNTPEPQRPAFLALSPDGSRLVAFGSYLNRHPSGVMTQDQHPARVWDLKDGTVRDFVTRYDGYGVSEVSWLTPDILVEGGRQLRMFDMAHEGQFLGTVTPLSASAPDPLVSYQNAASTTPDGLLCASVGPDHFPDQFQWQPLNFEEAWILAAPQRRIEPLRGSTLRVEVDLGDEEVNSLLGDSYAEVLEHAGCKIGPDGWLFRARLIQRPLTEEEQQQQQNAGLGRDAKIGSLVLELYAPGETTPAWVRQPQPNEVIPLFSGETLRRTALMGVAITQPDGKWQEEFPDTVLRCSGKSHAWPCTLSGSVAGPPKKP